MALKFVRLFVGSAGVLLLITAVAKLFTTFDHAKILHVRDPILTVSFRVLFWVLGLVEWLIALTCFFSKQTQLQLILLAWLSTNFVFYRIGLLWIGYVKPCSCMGNLTDALHIPPQTADIVMEIILAYLLIGSYVALSWLWWKRKKEIPNSIVAQ